MVKKKKESYEVYIALIQNVAIWFNLFEVSRDLQAHGHDVC